MYSTAFKNIFTYDFAHYSVTYKPIVKNKSKTNLF